MDKSCTVINSSGESINPEAVHPDKITIVGNYITSYGSGLYDNMPKVLAKWKKKDFEKFFAKAIKQSGNPQGSGYTYLLLFFPQIPYGGLPIEETAIKAIFFVPNRAILAAHKSKTRKTRTTKIKDLVNL